MSQTGKQQPRRRAPIVEISLIMMAVSLITLIILCLVPGAGKSTKNPVLAIYGDQGNFPSLSFRKIQEGSSLSIFSTSVSDKESFARMALPMR